MEREREKKEGMYWDLQLLNTGNFNNLYVMDKPVDVLNCLQQSPSSNCSKKTCKQPDSGSLGSCTVDTDSVQMGRLVGGKELYGRGRGAKRLDKTGRHCWARLASEGVQSILPTPWLGRRQGVQGQAWGCVSLADILLLVKVKYDVVTHLLYTEMLHEHHSKEDYSHNIQQHNPITLSTSNY
uniref:uncharacterized protein LOC109967785 isoform X2 n=1 Tax=Monopterus albus TaxID=43700 RepID=UPI0009B364C0|nr:uncharacterized protein LOC109967785 isoform X2 [Monopterus albus]